MLLSLIWNIFIELKYLKILKRLTSAWHIGGFPGGSDSKESACCEAPRDLGIDTWIIKIP